MLVLACLAGHVPTLPFCLEITLETVHGLLHTLPPVDTVQGLFRKLDAVHGLFRNLDAVHGLFRKLDTVQGLFRKLDAVHGLSRNLYVWPVS